MLLRKGTSFSGCSVKLKVLKHGERKQNSSFLLDWRLEIAQIG